MGESINWQDEFQRMGLNDTSIGISRESSQHDLSFQHRLSQQDDQQHKENMFPSFDSPVTLRYRDSVSSNASTLSRNSTMSSTDTRYFSAIGSPGSPNATIQSPMLRMWSWNSNHNQMPAPLTISTTLERPSSLSPIQSQFHQNQIPLSNTQQQSIVEPTGCFVPVKPLPFAQKSDITKHHYVIPTFAMTGESQADVMNLLFNQKDNCAFKPKEEYERTIPWHIDHNSSLVTLSQYTGLGQENPISRNYLLGLGQRLGITTILVIVSIEVIGTVYPLLDNLIKAMEINTNPSNLLQQDQPTWWSRVVLVINQQHGVSDHAAYNQRKSILVEEIPRIQERYRLSQPLSIIFLSTQVYDKIKLTNQGAQYQSCCQRILWQMMEKHMLSGRWCSELITLQNRMNSNVGGGSLLNVLNEDDETSSSSDDALFKTVIDYVDGKKKKPVKKKKKSASAPPSAFDNSNTHLSPTAITPLQRRSTRRQVQKLHCHDGDDATALPLPARRL